MFADKARSLPWPYLQAMDYGKRSSLFPLFVSNEENILFVCHQENFFENHFGDF
jgi:hypothetical protein